MRIGSQGVRNKNMKLINGKPLMYYTIKQAIESGKSVFDFLRGSERYKYHLGAQDHRTYRLSIHR